MSVSRFTANCQGFAMLMLLYLCVIRRQFASLLIWLPAVFTFGMCLFAPVVYLRYALPVIGSLPMGVACMLKNKKE